MEPAAAHSPAARSWERISLLPEDTDDCMTSAPFIGLALSAFYLLGTVSVVQELMHRDPLLLNQIQALSTAVSAAGVRVRDAGLLKDSFDVSLGVYAPEEIWIFSLAFDVIAQLGTLAGLPGKERALVVSDVQSLDWYTDKHDWKKAMKKAGAGPAAFHDLRTRTPHRAQ